MAWVTAKAGNNTICARRQVTSLGARSLASSANIRGLGRLRRVYAWLCAYHGW
jgi:hypothetical protein